MGVELSQSRQGWVSLLASASLTSSAFAAVARVGVFALARVLVVTSLAVAAERVVLAMFASFRRDQVINPRLSQVPTARRLTSARGRHERH